MISYRTDPNLFRSETLEVVGPSGQRGVLDIGSGELHEGNVGVQVRDLTREMSLIDVTDV